MGLYSKYILPNLIDKACGQPPIHKQREKVVPHAEGRVLEIGIGTGLNLQHYNTDKVEKLWGLDPALEMHSKAQARLAKTDLEVELLGLSAEKIPMDDKSFDTIVMTYTLCSIPDGISALGEMRRVLKPGGKMLFCEHGEAPDENIRKWQARLNPIWKHIGGGCHLDKPIPRMIKEAGFNVTSVETMYLPGPKFATFNYWGAATP